MKGNLYIYIYTFKIHSYSFGRTKIYMHKIVISHVSQFNLDPWGYNPVAQKRDTLKWVVIYMCDINILWFWYTHRVRLRFPYSLILEQSWFLQRGPLPVINLSYNPCRWRYKWVIGVTTPILVSGGIPLLLTVVASYLVGLLIFRWKTCLPTRASGVGCLLSYDLRFGVLYNPTGSKQQNVHHQWLIYIHIFILYMQRLRNVAFFLLDVSNPFHRKGWTSNGLLEGMRKADVGWDKFTVEVIISLV